MSEETTIQAEQCPRQTPWGYADTVKEIAPGIWSVSTPGHGGIYLAKWRRRDVPGWLIAPTPYSDGRWFEEDCDWALACMAFPVEFGPAWCYYALRSFGGGYLADRVARYMVTPMAELLRAEAAKFQPTPGPTVPA